MRTLAYYVWRVEIAIRSLLALISPRFKVECRFCKKWDREKGRCILIPSAKEWNNCVYFERRR